MCTREDATYKTSGPRVEKLVSRRTARQATIYGRELSVIRARKAREVCAYCGEDGRGHVEDDAHDRVEVQHDEHGGQQVGQEPRHVTPVNTLRSARSERGDVRDDEVHETVLEEEGHELRAAALDADDELVHAEQQDDEVEAHRVDERRGEDGVVRARYEAALAVDPGCLDEDTCRVPGKLKRKV